MPMAMLKATEEEFEVSGNKAVHRPTGARFTRSYPESDSDDAVINWGKAGSVLDNGDEYDQEDIANVARKILFK